MGTPPTRSAWLGAAAASTERVILGTSVLTPSLRYNPAVVAQAFATLGCLAPGRIILGVGTGESLNEVVVGAAWPDQKERFHRLKESVLLCEQLFREEFVTFEGEYYRPSNATVYDKPGEPGAGVHRRLRAGRIQAGGSHRGGLHLHLGQARRALYREPAAGGGRGPGEGRASR